MKLLVQLEQPVLVACRGTGFHLPHQRGQGLDLRGTDARHRMGERLRLEMRAQAEESARLDGRDGRDDRAAIALAERSARFLQAQHRLANGAQLQPIVAAISSSTSDWPGTTRESMICFFSQSCTSPALPLGSSQWNGEAIVHETHIIDTATVLRHVGDSIGVCAKCRGLSISGKQKAPRCGAWCWRSRRDSNPRCGFARILP